MAELDLAQAPRADRDDAERNVPEALASQHDASSDETATLRPPVSAELLLDDDAPDTVRRRIEPGPEATGGSHRESGVRVATPNALEASPDEDSEASPASASDPAGAPVHVDVVLATVQVRSTVTPEEPAPELLADDGASDPSALDLSTESGDASPSVPGAEGESALAEPVASLGAEDCGAAPDAPELLSIKERESQPPPAKPPVAATEVTPEVPHAASLVDDGDFSQEVPAGWIEEGADDDDAPSAVGALAVVDDETGEVGEEVQASWLEQGAELDAREPLDAAGLDAPNGDPGEVTARWIEEGERIERVAPSVPIPPSRRALTQPWIDEADDPVTPHDQGRSTPSKTADLPLAEDLRGRVLANRFLAEEITEQSAGSITYSAYHLALDSPVMIQVLPRGLACFGEACELVRRTAVMASMIGSAHIARMLDFGVFGGGWPYWVAEHVESKSLARLLGEEGKLGLRRVIALAKQLTAGLAAAHAAGIVHGHIKPDCLIVVDAGTRTESVRILGFGLLHAAGGQLTPPRSGVFGVPFYVSPEQAACRECDERTDLYALGAVLYELMTGRPPFTGGDFAAVLCQHLDDEPEPPSVLLDLTTGIARGLDEIVLRCLAKDPEQRYSSAAELADELVALEQSIGPGKRRPMPEVARPTATIHSPAPRVDSNASPGPKVIVSADLEGEALTLARPQSTAATELASSDLATRELATKELATKELALAPEATAQPHEVENNAGARHSAPPGEAAADGDASGWWGRLIGRVSGAVRRPS